MHRESKSIANNAASAKVSHIQRIVRWARPPISVHTLQRPMVLVSSVTCCDDYCGVEKSKSVTRNGIDRRGKRYKVKFVLLLVLSLILMIYILMVLKVWSLMFSESRHPKNVLRRIQSLLINKQIIHSPVTTIRQRPMEEVITDTDYFIIFDADIPGQGNGNLISGLLASHLLGDEFQRIVCVNPLYYSTFLDVFESIDPVAQRKCPSILHRIPVNNATYYQQNPKHMVTIINFLGAADECYLKNFLSDRTKQIIHIVGNTYPRWPTVPDYYFLHHYQPKQVLFDHLPYQNQPKIVVHLRDPDHGEVDPRLGLDDASLVALGDLLPKSHDTYLVTNNVDYFDRFTKCCSWSHAKWELVKHSATNQYWGKADYTDDHSPDIKRKQTLQMWSDWYTILMADTVYHTHSDFSISAIHWMNNHNSHSIVGYDTDTKKLETTVESWWRDGETIPLVQRTIEGKHGTTNELRACG
jgi:hypothetical protein